jgi:hypothetical protein
VKAVIILFQTFASGPKLAFFSDSIGDILTACISLLAVSLHSSVSSDKLVDEFLLLLMKPHIIQIKVMKETVIDSKCLELFQPGFWQGIFALGSLRRASFPEMLVRYLDAIIQRLQAGPATNAYNDSILVDHETLLSDVWDRLLLCCRQIGIQQVDWMCPGFEPWTECEE